MLIFQLKSKFFILIKSIHYKEEIKYDKTI